jgi:hypothetical protein
LERNRLSNEDRPVTGCGALDLCPWDGADEAEARRREEAFWMRFMFENAVDRDAALAYLVALKHRPPAGDRPSAEAVVRDGTAER